MYTCRCFEPYDFPHQTQLYINLYGSCFGWLNFWLNGLTSLLDSEDRAVQLFEGFGPHLIGDVGVNVQRRRNIRMAERGLYDLDVYTRLTHPRCECVAQRVAAEVRKEYRIVLPFREHLIVAVSDDPSYRFIDRTLVLRRAETVDKDKSRNG